MLKLVNRGTDVGQVEIATPRTDLEFETSELNLT